jgi:hypothetical protein
VLPRNEKRPHSLLFCNYLLGYRFSLYAIINLLISRYYDMGVPANKNIGVIESMSDKHPECPLYNPLNCKEYYNPKVCAFVKKDKVCLKKKKPKNKLEEDEEADTLQKAAAHP